MIADRIRDKLKEQSDRLLEYEENGDDCTYLEGIVQGLEWALDIAESAESDTGKKAKKRRKMVKPIPKDFAVQPLKPGENPPGKTTCGHCNLSWDDDIPTEWTPVPSGRCPFEYFHIHDED